MLTYRLIFAGAPAPYLFSVAQIANLPYRRLQIGRALAVFRRPGQGAVLQDDILRYSAARRSRNQYDPTTDEHGWTRIRESLPSSVLIRVHPWLKKSSRAATILGDTDRKIHARHFAVSEGKLIRPSAHKTG